MDHTFVPLRCRLTVPGVDQPSKVAELEPAGTPEELMAAAETAFLAMRDPWGCELPFITLEVYAPASGRWVQPIFRGFYRQVRVRGGLSYLGSWRERFDWCLAAVENEARIEAMTPR